MRLSGLLGPTYSLKSLAYDCQRCINMYPDSDEMDLGKDQEPMMLTQVPGLTLLHSLPRSPIRALYHTANNYIYCVAGNGLFLLTPSVSNNSPSLTHTLLAYLTTSTGFVSICDGIPNFYQGIANTGLINQVVVVDGSTTGYVFQEATTQVYQINSGTGYAGSAFVTFQDGFFIFSQPNTISGYYASDPQNISDLDTVEVNLNNDFVQRIISDHDLVWILGNRSLSVWQNSGGSGTTNTFQQIPGATAPQGSNAPWSIAQVGGQLLWINNDDRGWAEVAMAFGYRALRISNHAVEGWLLSLGDISQTIAWTYQDSGHSFYCLNNPNSNTTWCYDIAHKMWHERAFYSNGQYSRDLVQFHTNAFITGYGNIHLCGDYESGNIYQLDSSNFTFNGTPIRKERITPHSSSSLKRLYYSQLQLDVQAGQGLDGQGYPVLNGYGTPYTQTATNVLVSGNGPTYTLVGNDGLPALPTSSVSVSSTGSSSNWSNEYTVSSDNGTVTINSEPLTSNTITISSGNGTETNFQIPNIYYSSSTTANIYLTDWRGTNLQQQYPAENTNLCLSSYTFTSSWTSNNCSISGGEWYTPDYLQSASGSNLIDDNTFNPHYISIPYNITSGQVSNISIYAAGGSNTNTSLTGGVCSYSTSGSSPLTEYIMTINTPFTTGTLAIGDFINCGALSTPNQLITELLSGTLGAAGSTYLCYPGWTTNQSSQATTASRTSQRYLQIVGNVGQGSSCAIAIFNIQNGTIVYYQNCSPVITSVPYTTTLAPNNPQIYRCSISFTEANTIGSLTTGSAICSFSGSQMTVFQSPLGGEITIGATVNNLGSSLGVTVLSLASGTANQPGAVYNLSGFPSITSSASISFTIAPSTSALTPPLYIGLVNAYWYSNSYLISNLFPAYNGDGSSYTGIWGCQISPQASIMPLIQTTGLAVSDYVTYTPEQGLLVFEVAPFAEVVNSTTEDVIFAASSITATFSTTAPQITPTEYLASFTYLEGDPEYIYTGTDPQIGLSYSKDQGYTFSPEKYAPIGKLGDRFKRVIWRKLGMDRDRVWRFTCSDPVNLAILGAEINVKPAETGQ